MDALANERFVAFGGPAGSRGNVALVVDAPDETAIRARLGLDPWSAADMLRTVAIEEWTIWLGADERIATAQAPLYLVAYGSGPRWEDSKTRREQDGWDAHAAFMDALADRGVVLLGGPLNEQRAVVVMQHLDREGLRKQLAADPWHDDVLAIESIEPWTLWLKQPESSR